VSLKNLVLSYSFQKMHTSLGDLAKRGFDILVSFIVLILLAPFYGLIALAIHRDSPGPVFYRGSRMGRGGKPFQILKFRTMYEDPASYIGPAVTAQDDPRITELGRWLRDTKINELPQFWNVLKGDMSLVGPRPEDPTIAKTWPKAVWDEVLSVRPGITSPASIQYRNEESLLSFGDVLQKYLHELTPDKMRLDQLYVRYRSFWLDLDVLFWTGLVLIPQVRSYSPPETLIFVGPVTRLIRRYVRWFTIDLLVTFCSIGITGLIWRFLGPLDVGWLRSIILAIGFSLLFSLTGAALGVNRITWSKATYTDALDLLPSWMIASAIALIATHFWRILPIGLVLMASMIALCGFVVVRYRSRLITGALSQIVRRRMKAHSVRERVLIVGSGRTAEHIAWLLSHPAYLHKFQVVGFVVDDLMSQGMRMYGSRIIGTISQVPQLVKTRDIGVIILADHRMGNQGFQSIACACKGILTKVVVVPDIFGSLSGLFEISYDCQEKIDTDSLSDYRCEHCLARYSHHDSMTEKQSVEEEL
jgi:lipopolysaccharide/colanic/teichoic acid biosynthesis glycosyltransferase